MDEWAELITDVLGDMPGRITSAEIYRILKAQPNPKRLGTVMSSLGFKMHRIFIPYTKPQRNRTHYERGSATERTRDIYVYPDPISGEYIASYNPGAPPEPFGENPFK